MPSSLDFSTSGTGCALVTSVLRYNTQEETQSNGFTVKASKLEEAADTILEICSQYTGGRKETGRWHLGGNC